MKAELRGRGRRWRVWYEDEAGLAHPVQVYDRHGEHVGEILVGAPTGKLVEAHFEGTQDEAREYAEYLGATEITVRRTSTKAEALAKARAAARAARKQEAGGE